MLILAQHTPNSHILYTFILQCHAIIDPITRNELSLWLYIARRKKKQLKMKGGKHLIFNVQ